MTIVLNSPKQNNLLLTWTVPVEVRLKFVTPEEEENSKTQKISSIPEGIWWSIITMATVGYGDVVPRTFFGKLTGACCAIMGILSMSFPVPGMFLSNIKKLL